MSKKAVIILSGGLDSATCMGIAKEQGFELYPITFSYGQRHEREVEQAKKIAVHFQVREHRIIEVGFFHEIGGSALTDESIELPMNTEKDEIPVTYVPARNMIFLSLACAYAEVIKAEAVYIGVSGVDYSGYPDCRPEFINSMSKTVNLATKAGVSGDNISIEAPLIYLSKADTIKLGIQLKVPYYLTTSCYNGKELACGVCDSCRLRLKGFEDANAVDPIPYAAWKVK